MLWTLPPENLKEQYYLLSETGEDGVADGEDEAAPDDVGFELSLGIVELAASELAGVPKRQVSDLTAM